MHREGSESSEEMARIARSSLTEMFMGILEAEGQVRDGGGCV